MTTVAVTGATGAIGPAVVEALTRRGHRVRLLVRDPTGSRPPAAESVSGDISAGPALAELARGADALVHMAALLHVNAPSPALEGEYRRVNVEGTRRVVEAALAAGVGRVVLLSTISVYGSTEGSSILTEESPTDPTTYYARSKLAAEEIVLRSRRGDGAPLGTVLRMSAVYGPRMKGNFKSLARAIARGRFVVVGTQTNRRTLVHERDAAEAIVLAALHPSAGGAVYNVSDGHVHTLDEITRAISRACGRRLPGVTVPAGWARLAVATLEGVAGTLGFKAPALRARLEKYLEDLAVSGARIREQLGFDPAVDLETGWRETVEELRRQGEM